MIQLDVFGKFENENGLLSAGSIAEKHKGYGE